jgi:hypothetical protein
MIDPLQSLLRGIGGDVTAEEVADALWLVANGRVGGAAEAALADRVPAVADPRDAAWSRVAATDGKKTAPRLPSQADRAPLPSGIALARALRPLRTARREPPGDDRFDPLSQVTARPVQRASFDLVLVVDDGDSMDLWRPTTRQLAASLATAGTFGSVHPWQVDTSGANGKLPGLRQGRDRRRHGPMAPIGVSRARHQLILVVSDCTGPAWRSGSMAGVLRSWARRHPTAIIQVLPARLWELSALVPERVTWQPAWDTGAPNTQLRCYSAEGGPVPGVPVPVLGLDARALGSWSELISGTGARRVAGLAQVIGRPAVPADDGPWWPADRDAWRPSDDMPPGDAVQRFAAFASPEAMSLAGYLAAAGPLTLPVMRLIQRELLPGSVPANLAEVYLGGLLRRVAGAQEDTPLYDFRPGVRDLLFTRLTRSDAIRVMRIVDDQASARGAGAADGAADPQVSVGTAGGVAQAGPGSAAGATSSDTPSVPGRQKPAIWGAVPERNPKFTGRRDDLRKLRQGLTAADQGTPACTLHGLAGAGKTQVAVEYAYRYEGGYEIVWWVPAQQPSGVRASLSELWERLNDGASVAGSEPWARALDALRTGIPYRHWLLIFDNADRLADLEGLIPRGTGHVIITSRNAAWARQGSAIEVGALDAADSIDLLRQHADPWRQLSDAEAARIAEVTGSLPIALVQAASWQEDMPVEEFVRQFEKRIREVLDEDLPPGYPAPVFASWQRAVEQLREDNPGAVELLELCSMFAPEPIHRSLLTIAAELPGAGRLPEPLGEVLRDEWSFRQALRSLGRHALAHLDREQGAVEVHRLIQAAVRHRSAMREDRRTYLRHVVHLLLLHACAGIPANPADPSGWEQRRRIQPHLIPSEALDCEDAAVRALVLDQAMYLEANGDQESARKLAELAWRLWTLRLGGDHADTVAALRHITGA